MIHGADPILLNVHYIRPSKKKGIPEAFEVVYKDGNEVRLSYEPALVDIYFVKPEYRDFNYNKPQEKIERLDKVTCQFSEIKMKIAEDIGETGLDFVKYCYDTKSFDMLGKLYRHPYCFACDFQPEYYYMRRWYQRYELDLHPNLTMAMLDIEIDLIDNYVDLDNLAGAAHAPVNCLSIYFTETNTMYTLILEPKKPSKLMYGDGEEWNQRYTMYEEQLRQYDHMMAHMDDFQKRLHDEFDKMYGEITYKIRAYEEEIDLIADLFRLIHKFKPNFCLVWNMRFDILYLLERIKMLGYDPSSIMCDPDFKYPRCSFHVDRRTYEAKSQQDSFSCSSYTMYVCQMRLYAAIRKSGHSLRKVSLNYIANAELGDRKVEYPEEANIRTFAYRDWMLFIIYNIKDVLLQVGIERVTGDILTYYLGAHDNLTPYNKSFRETHSIRNFREKYFEDYEGKVQSNNLNIIDDSIDRFSQPDEIVDDEEGDVLSSDKISFKGAINADPLWNDYVGIDLLGTRSRVLFNNSIDYDMEAFYPSIKIASNMDPETLLFKAMFNNNDFTSGEFVNRSLNTQYEERDKNGNIRPIDITGEAVNTYVSNNPLTFAYNYLNMPSITELYRLYRAENK